jgi:hypothetical protein
MLGAGFMKASSDPDTGIPMRRPRTPQSQAPRPTLRLS